MSWTPYIDSVIAHCAGHCDVAAIIGKDGSIWAGPGYANGIDITADEAALIGKTVKDGKHQAEFGANGIWIAGVKYRFLKTDDGVTTAKLKDFGAVTLEETNGAIVIGHTKEGSQQGTVNTGVNNVASHMTNSGY